MRPGVDTEKSIPNERRKRSRVVIVTTLSHDVAVTFVIPASRDECIKRLLFIQVGSDVLFKVNLNRIYDKIFALITMYALPQDTYH